MTYRLRKRLMVLNCCGDRNPHGARGIDALEWQ
jgi:hypothetical protein